MKLSREWGLMRCGCGAWARVCVILPGGNSSLRSVRTFVWPAGPQGGRTGRGETSRGRRRVGGSGTSHLCLRRRRKGQGRPRQMTLGVEGEGWV